MGLFDKLTSSNADKTTESSEFKSIIIDTVNVIKELKNIAVANHLKSTDLAFKILKISTFYSDDKSEENEMGEEEMKQVLDDAFLLNPTIKFKQRYRVEIFKIQHNDDLELIPQITLSGNKSLTKIIATVAPSHDFKYTSKLEQAMIDDILLLK